MQHFQHPKYGQPLPPLPNKAVYLEKQVTTKDDETGMVKTTWNVKVNLQALSSNLTFLQLYLMKLDLLHEKVVNEETVWKVVKNMQNTWAQMGNVENSTLNIGK
jgi:hypothetical protein